MSDEKTPQGDDASTVPSADAQPAVGGTGESADAAAGADEDRSSFLGRVQNAWRHTVGAYATDEGETRNLFGRLVDFGNITGEEAKKLLAQTQDRIEENRKELEHRVDASLKRAVPRVSPPSAEEIVDLTEKVDDIERRIAALEA